MRRMSWLVLLLALIMPGLAAATMDNYCSAPPYVTRSIAPNIMVLMDNSSDMYKEAYIDTPSDDYSPAKTYLGYFEPTSCYSYNSKFQEAIAISDCPAPVGTGSAACTSGIPDCPSTAPFRGNLMNWATMSKYDVLQKVLIGGNAVSKQASANTLLSIGGDFADKVYNGCRFQVSNANLTITEDIPNGCSLLNPSAGFAKVLPQRPIPSIGSLIARLATPATTDWTQIAASRKLLRTEPIASKTSVPPRSVMETAIAAIGGVVPSAELANIWENIAVVGKAWAAACPAPTQDTSYSLVASVGEPYEIRLNSFNFTANNTVVNWTVDAKPTWMDNPIRYVHTSKITNYGIILSGTPTTSGSGTVTVSYTSGTCTPGTTKTLTISILVKGVEIVTPASNALTLPAGTINKPYTFDLLGQGGVKPLLWSTSAGLPPGLSIETEDDDVAGETSYIGHIVGTPTAAGDYPFTINLIDSSSPARSASISVSLTIKPDLTITTASLPDAVVGRPYSASMSGTGGLAPYSWSHTGSLPPGVTLAANGVFSGTPAVGSSGSYSITVTLTDNAGRSVSKNLVIEVVIGATYVEIFSSDPLPTAYKGEPYTYQMEASGGATPYTWSIVSGAPDGSPAMTIDPATGLLSWTPNNNNDTTYTNLVIRVIGAGLHADERTFSVQSLKISPRTRSASFNVKVDIDEEPLVDLNGNDIWDLGETYTENNGIPGWQGKQGLFQKFWDSNLPKARWGMSLFKVTAPLIGTCLPASPVASWYTGIQNAAPAGAVTLASGLYSTIKYYGFDGGFTGCTNSDPIDNIPCRKNFILIISSGADVTGTAYPLGTSGCNQTNVLERNACVGYKTDLRSAASGKQNTYTYIVNTMGTNTSNNAIMRAAAEDAGGGKYYDASDAATLETKLTQALQDILSQAASGTAVSVLTTSSRGIGSMVQAYFLPVRTDGTRDITWTGYTQDLWIDPQDNLREDSVQDLQLKPTEDKVVKLFFDTATNETRVARFTTDVEGGGGTLASCTAGQIEPFSATKYLWEAGQKLALKNPDDRTLMTSKKVIHGSTITNTFATPTFTTANVTGTPALLAALNAATAETPVYTATEIVDYVRGVDKETAEPSRFRDRRLTVGGSLKVWKLGDIISSTPKVFANTPANTYHIDYGDSTYYSYVTSSTYKERSSVAFVGANDGLLHAFRVGYLKDTGLGAGIKGLFKNSFAVSDTVNTEIGQEMWGFIPFNAFPYLKYLANPDYCHIYFNDLSVRIVDASVGDSSVNAATFPTATKALASWRSILIGGMRFGGACAGSTTPAPPMAGVGYSSYYAIDITNPENPVPLWEFSDPDMGYATSFPSIVRTGNKDINGNWYVALGSGSTRMPKASIDMDRDKDGYVYFLDLKSGELIKKIGLGHNAIVSDIVAIDSQKDANVDALYFGTSYRPTTTTWGGKLLSLNVAGNVPGLCGTGVTRTSAECATNQKIIFTGAFPFTASPDVARDPSGNVWIYAGSGKYVSDIDEADDSNQIFLGIKTNLADSNYPVQVDPTDTTNFVDQSLVTTTGTVTSTRFDCLYNPAGSGSTQFSLQEVVTGIAPTSTPVDVPTIGWYLTLTTGERVISRPLAVGGLVDFLTYKPDSDLCSYGGSSYLYAVDYLRGVAPTNVAIRSPSTTNNVKTGTVTISKGILLGPGAPPTGEAITIPPPKEGQEQLKKKIQVATGVIVETENTPVISTISKVVHWLKK